MSDAIVGRNITIQAEPDPNEKLFKKVHKLVSNRVSRLNVVDEGKEDALPRFRTDEMVLGHVLGRGSFAVVRQLCEIRLDGSRKDDRSISDDNERKRKPFWKRRKSLDDLDCNDSHYTGTTGKNSASAKCSGHGKESTTKSDGGSSSREHLARRVWSKNGGKFVVKQVDPNLKKCDSSRYLEATICLEMEVKYLAALDHPHIVTLMGIGRSSASKGAGCCAILEYIPEKLTQRLNHWMQLDRATRGITGFVTCGKNREAGLLTERMLVAFDIAEAMDFLHSKNILYRDLKPDNIGFDAEGVLKVYDFGLAKELVPEDRTEDGLYRLTGMTGGMRYMAPEVALNQPYNFKADVYSWSMIFWYILMLEPPFCTYTPTMFTDRVHQRGSRPLVDEKWSKIMKKLLNFGWHAEIQKRPTFKDIKAELREQISTLDSDLGAILCDFDTVSVATTTTTL